MDFLWNVGHAKPPYHPGDTTLSKSNVNTSTTVVVMEMITIFSPKTSANVHVPNQVSKILYKNVRVSLKSLVFPEALWNFKTVINIKNESVLWNFY